MNPRRALIHPVRTLVLTIVLALTAHSAIADPVLVGTWKSDHELTMGFARKHANLAPEAFHLLGQMMGRLTLVFSQDRVTNRMPDWEFESVDGIKSQVTGFVADVPYELLATSSTQAVLASVEPVTGERTITTCHFEGKDIMWVYLGGQPFSDLNTREYFIRIK